MTFRCIPRYHDKDWTCIPYPYKRVIQIKWRLYRLSFRISLWIESLFRFRLLINFNQILCLLMVRKSLKSFGVSQSHCIASFVNMFLVCKINKTERILYKIFQEIHFRMMFLGSSHATRTKHAQKPDGSKNILLSVAMLYRQIHLYDNSGRLNVIEFKLWGSYRVTSIFSDCNSARIKFG